MAIQRLPSLVKSWRPVAGNAIVGQETTGTLQAAQLFVTVIGYLLDLPAPGWTCVGSCDASSFNMSGTNLLTDKTKIISSAGGNRSWIVLQQTATGMQVCFEFSSTAAYILSGTVSPGGLFSGGALNAAPTATPTAIFKSTSNSWCMDNATGRMNVCVWHSVDGKNTRVAIACGKTLISIIIMGAVHNPVPGYTLPYVGLFGGSSSLTNTQLHTPTFYTQFARCIGVHSATAMPMFLTLRASQGTMIPDLANTVGFLGTSGCGPMCQPGIYSLTTAMRGRHGSLADMWFGSNNVPVGEISQDPVDLTRRVVHLGGWVLPWTLGETRFAT